MADFLSKLSKENFQEMRELGFEDKVVQRILGYYKLTKHKIPLMDFCLRKWGNRKLELRAFCEYFGSFPAYLVGHCESHLPKDMQLDKLFKHFQKTKVYKFRELMKETVPLEASTYGVVFHFPYTKGLVLHDNFGGEDTFGVRITVRDGKQCLYIETLEDFLTGLNWTPFDD